MTLPNKWFVVTGPDDPGTEFESWADAREYLISLKNRDARILGPGCDPEWGDSPEYEYNLDLDLD
jgi:hypothetical protein